ncbi:MAG: phosphoenolpyruvate carboxylase, partial [Proteobacteria bacterium]
FRKIATKFAEDYKKEIGVLHPNLNELKTLLHIFPALVVPLEFREASDMLLSDPSGKSLAIVKMLKKLAQISKGGDPRWYVRGFIVSMTNEVEHLEAAARFVRMTLKSMQLPVIPLFEQASALQKSSEILTGMLESPEIGKAIRNEWANRVELMLGYSDSSKESGVLRSRLQVDEAMSRLDKLCEKNGITPIFFQGSGGSTDRGGGSIEEQTAWWPSGALRNYKVTVQGEMIERSLASPEITRGQIEKIVQSAGNWKDVKQREKFSPPVLRVFADRVAELYQATVHDPKFLDVIGQATPYRFLDLLKIGSRPTKRSTSISVEGLRAIPWILCWTQTRTLFPTWWGVGSAWEKASPDEREELKSAIEKSPVFKGYVRALGYTLAKVRLRIWRLYLEESGLEKDHQDQVFKNFCREYDLASEFAKTLLGPGNSLIAWR